MNKPPTKTEASKGMLIFFCGKMGAGKTTRSREIAQMRNAVLLSEDEWLSSLYPGCILTLDDYIKYSSRLKPQVKQLVHSILMSGVDVVLDFPANTIQQRVWFKGIYSEIQASHELIYIDQTNETCLRQIIKRRTEQPERAAVNTEKMFKQVTKYFVAPTLKEGFNITVFSANSQHKNLKWHIVSK